MNVENIIEQNNQRIADVYTVIITEIYGNLVELFKEIKQIQPNIDRIHMGMGTWSFDGNYTCEVLDYATVKEDYPNLEYLTGVLIDDDGDKWIVYKDYKCENFDDFIKSYINNFNNYSDLEHEHLNLNDYVNDACVNFYNLCNYLVEINGTTLYDGVNENGVIVTYGKGSHLDTYIDAIDSDQVELLKNANIPIVLYDSIKGVYTKHLY